MEMYYLFIAFMFAVGLLLGWPMRNLVLQEEKILKNINTPAKLLEILFSENKSIHVAFDVAVGAVLGSCFALIGSQVWMTEGPDLLAKLLLVKVLMLVVLLLIYLAVYDLLTMEIPALVSYSLLGLLVVINVVLAILLGTGEFEVWQGNMISPVSNIMAGLLAGGAVALIVMATKEKGMGAGDIILAAILGLSLGLSKTFVGFYVTILSATFVGLVYALKKGTLKNVPIPFVPFIVAGIIATFLLWSWLLPLLRYTVGLSFLS